MSEPEPITEGPALVVFESRTNEAPPGTPAAPRPSDRPREGSAEAFARELADRVLAHVRAHPTGLSAEQLAALVQQFVARRSA